MFRLRNDGKRFANWRTLIKKVYSPHMATSNSTPVSSRISNICSPTDNFPLPTSSTIPAGPTSPQRRRIKYPPFDGIETDIDCSTEMGHGLHLEVRKIYNLLQEKDDTIKFIEIAKINAESNMYNSAKKLKVKEESEGNLGIPSGQRRDFIKWFHSYE